MDNPLRHLPPVCILACLLLVLPTCGQHKAQSVTLPAAPHRATPTATSAPILGPPTPVPTPQHTPSYLRMTHGPTVLGVSVSNFFGKYGDATVTHDHRYTWSVYKNGNPFELIGTNIHPDGTVYRIDVVNTSDTDWRPAQSTHE